MLVRVLNGVAAVLGAGASAQFPEFFQQYLQRLGGRVDQSRLELERLLADAESLGRSVEAYLSELLNSGTEAARQAAQRELERVGGSSELQASYDALTGAEPLERPFVFAWHFDPVIAADTLSIFAPALPVTIEGLVYAAFGMIAGLGIVAACETSVRRLRVRPQRTQGSKRQSNEISETEA